MPNYQDVYNNIYKPDVLSCLADLSNDEVFTPPDVANKMLDLLPQELFRSPDTKFLDPACKTGVFLREIAKRLIAGLADKIPNLQERCDWIFHHQLYGIAITELTSLLSRRSVYCSKYANGPFSISHFDNPIGEIVFHKVKHTWDKKNSKGKCIYCGTAYKGDLNDIKREGLETHAYEFIHTQHPEEVFNMKFDVIISNPPYQLSDGGGGAKKSASPIYHYFIRQAIKLNPRYITMITPSRWLNGGKGLSDFRKEMLNDHRLIKLVDFDDSKECFLGVDIPGGVSYFLWARDQQSEFCNIINVTKNGDQVVDNRRLNELPSFVRDNRAVPIVRKLLSFKEPMMDKFVRSRRPFGLESATAFDDEGTIILRNSKGLGKISLNRITQGLDILHKWKVIVSKVTFEHAGTPDKNGQMRVLSVIQKLPPDSACTESYLVVGAFDSEKEADGLLSYLKTKFVRFLIMQMLASMNMSKSSYFYVPVQDFTRTWKDEDLIKKYGLSDEEWKYIDSIILPMPEGE